MTIATDNPAAIGIFDDHASAARSTTRPLRTDVIDTADAFAALRDEWTTLIEAARGHPTAFLNHGFLATWFTYFSGHRPGAWAARLITVREAGRLVLAWPLAIEPYPVKTLRWMGEPISQYGDALIACDGDAAAWVDAAWTKIRALRGIDVIDLARVREDAAIAPFLADKLSPLGTALEAPYLDLTGLASENDLMEAMRSKSRRELRRKIKKLEAIGDITVEALDPGLDCASMTAKGLGFKRLWLDDLGLTSRVFADPRALRLLNDLARTDNDSGFVAIALKVNGHPVAIELGLRRGTRYMAYLGSYNPAYAIHSPGTVQMARMIGWA
ncbi:MAG: GNAT family N-acetyltransferase, partial [Pseudomonadota bacterium]